MQDSSFDPAKHLTKVNGKDYLQVMWRLVWLRSEYPEAQITTQLISHTDTQAVFSAQVSLPGGGISTGHGSETPGDFPDYLEKAETKAVGRALAMLGYGTQFAPEVDEGTRIVDSPRPSPQQPRQMTSGPTHTAPVRSVNGGNGNGGGLIGPSDKQWSFIDGLIKQAGWSGEDASRILLDEVSIKKYGQPVATLQGGRDGQVSMLIDWLKTRPDEVETREVYDVPF